MSWLSLKIKRSFVTMIADPPALLVCLPDGTVKILPLRPPGLLGGTSKLSFESSRRRPLAIRLFRMTSIVLPYTLEIVRPGTRNAVVLMKYRQK